MGVEAVVFFRPELADDFRFARKQGMQLASKMRFLSAQMEALLTNDLWRRNAEHANRMARLLEQEVKKIPRIKIVYPVEANGVFAQIPREAIKEIQERYFFYVWSEEESVVRWMCSFDTTEQDIREFTEFIEAVVRDLPS
jgi:threonine aldolase